MSNSLEERVIALEKLLVYVIDNMGETRKAISEGFQKTDDNFNKIHQRIDNLYDQLDNLSGSTKNNFHKVDLNLESIKEEIGKINQATGYEEAINNLKAVRGGQL